MKLEKLFSHIDFTFTKYLNEHNTIHGDLNPENILMDKNMRAHIGDFGLVKILDEAPFTAVHGSPHYHSPEQLFIDDQWQWDFRSDYFTVCIIFVELIITSMNPLWI